MTSGRAARVVGRHPRLWGIALAVLLLAAYVGVLRPGRVLLTHQVALPLFASVDTPRARSYDVGPAPRQPTALLAVPRAGTDAERQAGIAQWAAPAGVLFILPAMFLVAAFPTRPYWLYLLGYHAALGVVAGAVFAVGLAGFEPAFALYTFSRTYMTEAVSLAVPLLLWLAGRAEAQPSASTVA